MSTSPKASSGPNPPRPDRAPDGRELLFQVPEKSEKPPSSDVPNQCIPDELLVSLTSTVRNRNPLTHGAHHRQCKESGFRRPDAVWHHPLGREKYKYLIDQQTSLPGVGRDISFMCDATTSQMKTTPLPPITDRITNKNSSVSESLIPEEYYIVKNKGLRRLELFEDAFTVQLKDDEQNLWAFPSLRPSGRQEVLQLMRMMDNMLEEARVDQQIEEMKEISQMEGLLKLVRAEQNIYNVVFHELISQVSVGCVERGQLLVNFRKRYQSLLVKIPHCLKGLHSALEAQRALNHQLTAELYRIKSSFKQLSVELSRTREHDAFVSQQVERAHQQLAEELHQTHNSSHVAQGYYELYELQSRRLKAQLLQMTEERDSWSQVSYIFALKLLSVKKVQLVSHLHVSEQTWYKTAVHCSMFLASKDTEDLKGIVEFTDLWKEELTDFMSQLKKKDHAHCEQISAIQQGLTKWSTFCTTHEKSPDPKYNRAAVEEIQADLKQWLNMLALQSERYQGEELLCCQQTLAKLSFVLEKWLDMSLQLLRRHISSNRALSGHSQALSELDRVISELHEKLNNHINGENGIHSHIMTLAGLMESWITNLAEMIGQKQTMPVLDWPNLEKTLGNWHSLADVALQRISALQIVNQKDKNKVNLYTETEEVLDKVQEFITSLSSFTDSEKQTLSEEIASIHKAQSRWMLNLLILMVPDYDEDLNQEHNHHYITSISVEQLEEDVNVLADKLEYHSKYFTSSCQLILEEQIVNNPLQVEGENEMYECRKLQNECTEWVETCRILLSRLKGGPVQMPVHNPDPTLSSDVPVSSSDSMESLVNKEIMAEGGNEFETEQKENPEVTYEPENLSQGELMARESPLLEIIDDDGNIIQRKLGRSKVQLTGTEELLVTPATEETQKAFSDLVTVGLLQQELHDLAVQFQNAERRALKAEEALQAVLEKNQDLERQLQGWPSLEPKEESEVVEIKKTPQPSPPPVTKPSLPKKTSAEAKPTSITKRTKKR